MKLFNKLVFSLLGASIGVAAGPAMADDAEVFTNSAFLSQGVRPNVLFIIDTSGSMSTEVGLYDPARTYTGSCDPGKVYWRTTDTEVPPDCTTTTQWVSVANNRCRTAAVGMGNDGWWRGRTQQIVTQTNSSWTTWGNLIAGRDDKLECSGDNNNHGDLPGTSTAGSEPKIARGGNDANRWGTGNANAVNWNNRDRYSLYSGNYANWYHYAGGSNPKSRLDIVRDAAKSLIDNLDGVNLGIMRYSQNAQGGMVTYPVSELTAATRTAMKAELDTYLPSGNTPLSETMYEAHQYLKGSRVHYGLTSTQAGELRPSVSGSRNPSDTTRYDSPMDYSCQNNYIVYLTDGLPTTDNDADARIQALPDFNTYGGGACPPTIPYPETGMPTSGRCLENLTRYMRNYDLRSGVTGMQNVTSYFIGFGTEIASSKPYLDAVAEAGGGRAYAAADSAGLAATLEEIFGDVVDNADTTFVSPAVSVNAFNRTQNFNDLYVSVFAPTKNYHWPGNLKKYQIIDGDIRGVNTSVSAVDPLTGFFKLDAQALNTPGDDPDGPDATLGGSAAKLPAWSERKVYVNMGTYTDLTHETNAFATDNALLTATLLGASNATERTDYIELALGRDATDIDGDGDSNESRMRMGDPMHARPAIVIYGGSEDAPSGLVFTPTNDGLLHAFKLRTVATAEGAEKVQHDEDGEEAWAFMPYENLARLKDLHDNPVRADRNYSLDGDIRVFKYDINNNGLVDGNDRVLLFFGQRRGGNKYYALDVTDPDTPRFLWQRDPSNLGFEKLGRAWSTPEVARVNVAGATQNNQKFVLIFGGGYDIDQDNYAYTTDDDGNALFMVDMMTGALLWTASNADANLNNTAMNHSFPSGITVVDTDNDSFADRMYATDTGGRVWRFDITNGNSANTLVAGGVFATLGGAADNSSSNNRRFYSSPDVAPISSRGSKTFANIAIGSGYRGHPLETTTQDRFYAIRDYRPFDAMTAAEYAAWTPITDANLVNVTDNVNTPVTDGANGWKLELRLAGGWRGEKVLGESTTAAGVIFFTTFTPLAANAATPCLAGTRNRAYAVWAANGRPYTRWNTARTGPLDELDRFVDLQQKGIAPPVSILPNPDNPKEEGICQVGAQILNRCVKFGSAVRSFWERR